MARGMTWTASTLISTCAKFCKVGSGQRSQDWAEIVTFFLKLVLEHAVPCLGVVRRKKEKKKGINLYFVIEINDWCIIF